MMAEDAGVFRRMLCARLINNLRCCIHGSLCLVPRQFVAVVYRIVRCLNMAQNMVACLFLFEKSVYGRTACRSRFSLRDK